MAAFLNRRSFLKACGASAAVGLFGMPSLSLANNYDPIYYHYDGVFDEERYRERTIIREAMELLHNRFRDLHVVNNVYRLLSRGWHLGGGVWEAANLPSQYTYRDLLYWQMHVLRQPGKPLLPHVHIEPFHEENDIWARAPVGTVTVRHESPGEESIRGEFRVRLNRYWLGGPGNGSNPLAWAQVIAHEMLHNLGHRHDDTSDGWQINVFDRAVYCNGHYRIGDPTHRFR